MLQFYMILFEFILWITSFFLNAKLFIHITYIILSCPLLIDIFQNIKKKKYYFDELFILIISLEMMIIHRNQEASAVLLIYQIGKLLFFILSLKKKKDLLANLPLKEDIAQLKNQDANPNMEKATIKIEKVVKTASETKSTYAKKMGQFLKKYIPFIIIISILLFLVLFISKKPFEMWFYRFLIFFIIPYFANLVFLISLCYFYAIIECSQRKILVKEASVLEKLAKIQTIVFNKTGTITEGNYEVDKIIPYQIESEELLSYIAYAEYYSHHPIALAIKGKYKKNINKNYIKNYEEKEGMGIKAIIAEDEILIGNQKLFHQYQITYPKVQFLSTTILVAKNKEYIGTIVMKDVVKNSCYQLIDELKKVGLKKTIMLSGDEKDFVLKIASKLQFDEAYGGLLPAEKVKKIETLRKEQNIILVRNEMNPISLSVPSILNINIGSIDSESLMEISDIVILDNHLLKIADVYQLAIKTKKIVQFTIGIISSIKIILFLLGIFGLVNIGFILLIDIVITLLMALYIISIYQH